MSACLVDVLAMGLAGGVASQLMVPALRREAAALSVRLGGRPIRLRPNFGAELVLGWVIGMFCGQAFGISLPAWSALFLSLLLATLAWIDLDTRLLPDFLTLPLLAAGLMVNFWGVFAPWPQALAGAIFGYGGMATVAMLYRHWVGRDGLGGGDLKCVAALGAWLGWRSLPELLLLASLLSVVVGGCAGARDRRPLRGLQAFGPWLAVSGLVQLFLGARVA